MARWVPMIGALLALGACEGRRVDIGATAAQAQDIDRPELACYEAAIDQTNLSEDQSRVLCRGAESTAPVACHVAARDRLTLSMQQGIDLCQCARSTEPVDCVENALRETTLSEQEAMQMCDANCERC